MSGDVLGQLVAFIAGDGFVIAAIVLVFVIGIGATFPAILKLLTEGRAWKQIVDQIAASNSAPESKARLKGFLGLGDGDGLRDRPPEPKGDVRSHTLTAVAQYVGAYLTIERSKQYSAGLRPSRVFLLDAFNIKSIFGLNRISDFVIRLALFFTFVGIAAALFVAKDALAPTQSPTAGPGTSVDQATGIVRNLISLASVKFWISAAGLLMALVLWIVQEALEFIVKRMLRSLSATVDAKLPDAWAGAESSDPELLARELRNLSEFLMEQVRAAQTVIPQSLVDALKVVPTRVEDALFDRLLEKHTELLSRTEAIRQETRAHGEALMAELRRYFEIRAQRDESLVRELFANLHRTEERTDAGGKELRDVLSRLHDLLRRQRPGTSRPLRRNQI